MALILQQIQSPEYCAVHWSKPPDFASLHPVGANDWWRHEELPSAESPSGGKPALPPPFLFNVSLKQGFLLHSQLLMSTENSSLAAEGGDWSENYMQFLVFPKHSRKVQLKL